MLEYNLIANTIPHQNSYSNMFYPDPELKVVKFQQSYSGVSIFVDELVTEVDRINSKHKVAWLIEPPVIKTAGYEYFQKKVNRDKFDYILTFHDGLIKQDPNKVKLFPYGACWIKAENCGLGYQKTKLISIVASSKNYAPGHQYRHKLINYLRSTRVSNIDLYGTAYNEFPHTDEGRLMPFKDYKYSIVIENMQLDNYFTDKILDCFAVGTIPIYLGAPNIHDYFDGNGIIKLTGDLINDEKIIKLVTNTYKVYDLPITQNAIKNNFDLYYRKFENPDKNLRLFLENEFPSFIF